jgi:hypothetical protein
MEYVVPAAVILLSAGVLTSIMDADTLLSSYFLSASGHTQDNMSGTKFETQGLAENSYGEIDNGYDGFSSFVKVRDGNGKLTGEDGGGIIYADIPDKTRTVFSNPEQLFPDTTAP